MSVLLSFFVSLGNAFWTVWPAFALANRELFCSAGWRVQVGSFVSLDLRGLFDTAQAIYGMCIPHRQAMTGTEASDSMLSSKLRSILGSALSPILFCGQLLQGLFSRYDLAMNGNGLSWCD